MIQHGCSQLETAPPKPSKVTRCGISCAFRVLLAGSCEPAGSSCPFVGSAAPSQRTTPPLKSAGKRLVGRPLGANLVCSVAQGMENRPCLRATRCHVNRNLWFMMVSWATPRWRETQAQVKSTHRLKKNLNATAGVVAQGLGSAGLLTLDLHVQMLDLGHGEACGLHDDIPKMCATCPEVCAAKDTLVAPQGAPHVKADGLHVGPANPAPSTPYVSHVVALGSHGGTRISATCINLSAERCTYNFWLTSSQAAPHKQAVRPTSWCKNSCPR